MLGRLLLIAVGAVAGIIGKTVYDERKTSYSFGSAKEEPPKPKADKAACSSGDRKGGQKPESGESLDPREEIGKCMSEIGRLESELEALKNSAGYSLALAAAKETEIAAAKKRLAELTAASQSSAA